MKTMVSPNGVNIKVQDAYVKSMEAKGFKVVNSLPDKKQSAGSTKQNLLNDDQQR